MEGLKPKRLEITNRAFFKYSPSNTVKIFEVAIINHVTGLHT